MVRKTRSDKKDTICKCCGHECSISQKLCKHLKRKNLCRPKTDTPIQAPIQVIQEVNQQSVQEPDKHYKLWEARLHKRWVQDLGLGDCKRPENLNDCKLLCHDLDQYDPKAHRLSTKKELEEDEKWFRQEPQVPEADLKAGPGPVTQMHREKANNEKFRHLEEITDEQERDLEFRE
ncbi:hypothetical protein C1646_770992 [Rhizophagus diaphanus]|nr:hypothetical protein C1646_770992 [Rhizophagus diaphanus] [Rhizophagus sp. MUCL 43196]